MTSKGAAPAAKVRPKPIRKLECNGSAFDSAGFKGIHIPGTNEHSYGLSGGLNGRGYAHNGSTNEDGFPTTQMIREIG